MMVQATITNVSMVQWTKASESTVKRTFDGVQRMCLNEYIWCTEHGTNTGNRKIATVGISHQADRYHLAQLWNIGHKGILYVVSMSRRKIVKRLQCTLVEEGGIHNG